MRSAIRHPATAAALFAAASLIFVACSDSTTTGPTALRAPAAPARDSGAALSIPVGSTQIAIASSAGTQYCGIAAGVFAPVFGTTTFVGSCGASQDLQTNLTTIYNPGWEANFATSSWIGPTGADANSNEYRARPGTYDFQTTFTIPAGATGVGLNLTTMGDNVVNVYLNGHAVGGNNPTQDCPTSGACYWDQSHAASMFDNTQAHFNIGGTNTIDIFLIDLRIGMGSADPTNPLPPAFNGNACTNGPPGTPQTFGELGFGTAFDVPTSPDHQAGGASWDPTTCLNPTGLDFVGTAFYTPAAVNHGCTLGFWKTHTGLGTGNQANAWPAPYVPGVTTLGGAGFTNTGNQGVTMLDALSFSGGPTVQDAKNNLMKQAVAALLNAATPGMNYPLSVAQVLSQVNTALASGNKGTILALAATLDGFNSLEGPLC